MSSLITIRQSKDYAYFEAVMRRPEIWEKVADDNSGDPENCVAPREHLYLKVDVDAVPAGFFVFKDLGAAVWEIHVALLVKGRVAIEAFKACFKLMFEQAAAQALVSVCPKYCRHALFVALRCGMQKVGRHENYFLKNGQLWGVDVIKITREQWAALKTPKDVACLLSR